MKDVLSHPLGLCGHLPMVMDHYGKLIREYGSTLYVGLARAVSPTNTNFQLTFY